jgi:hypothetical protein
MDGGRGMRDVVLAIGDGVISIENLAIHEKNVSCDFSVPV